MVADQGCAEIEPVGDLADRRRRIEAGQNDAQARRIAEQAKQIGQLGRVLIRQQQGGPGGASICS
jgi:hypothetical protein